MFIARRLSAEEWEKKMSFIDLGNLGPTGTISMRSLLDFILVYRLRIVLGD